MCRVLSYLGQPLILENLLYKPDNSLVTQTYDAKQIAMLNLAGFGFISWKHDSPAQPPHYYRTHAMPFYDNNLKNLASIVTADCLLAHIRGVTHNTKNVVSDQNVHPFKFDNTSIAFAHNGDLHGYEDLRFDLLNHTKMEYKKQIHGTTDTEGMYALFLSRLTTKDGEHSVASVFSALIETLQILKKIRKKHGIAIASPLNFFISNGDFIVATRFVFNYGHYEEEKYLSPHYTYHSLWYTFGERYGIHEGSWQMLCSDKQKSIIIASEPLTEDSTTWIEMPEYSFLGATLVDGEVVIESMDIMM